MNALQRLNHLERLYDGPIPPHQLSPPGLYALNSARENLRFMTQLVRSQTAMIRARRTLFFAVEPYMLADLQLYWRQRRRYQAEVIRLGKARA
jgi:hypothetical protein